MTPLQIRARIAREPSDDQVAGINLRDLLIDPHEEACSLGGDVFGYRLWIVARQKDPQGRAITYDPTDDSFGLAKKLEHGHVVQVADYRSLIEAFRAM